MTALLSIVAERDTLAEENRMLREALMRVEGHDLTRPACLLVSSTEWRVLRVLMVKSFASKDMLYDAICNDRPEADWPQPKMTDVIVSKIRKKLKPLDLMIKTVWGAGYEVEPDSRARLAAMCGWHTAAELMPSRANLLALAEKRTRPRLRHGAFERAAQARGVSPDDIGGRLFEVLNADATLIDNVLDDGVTTPASGEAGKGKRPPPAGRTPVGAGHGVAGARREGQTP